MKIYMAIAAVGGWDLPSLANIQREREQIRRFLLSFFYDQKTITKYENLFCHTAKQSK